MIKDFTIEYLKKLSYIDDVVKAGNFYIVIHYGDNQKLRLTRRAGPIRIKSALDKIKKEISYKDETKERSEISSFYVG